MQEKQYFYDKGTFNKPLTEQLEHLSIWPTKMFPVIDWLQNWCSHTLFLFFCQLVKYVIHVSAVIGTRPNMVAKKSLTNGC